MPTETEVKTRPILFSDPMVRAILDGRKTQTRRVIKPQPLQEGSGWWYKNEWHTDDESMQYHIFHDVYGNKGSPYGSVYSDGSADRLWVREAWTSWADEVTRRCIDGAFDEPCLYRADYGNDCPSTEVGGDYHWKPSIHMPRAYSRITLEVTDVRVERVQEIDLAGTTAEGTPGMVCGKYQCSRCNGAGRNITWPTGCPDCRGTGLNHHEYFRQLWDSINRKRGFGWKMNPFVWVIEFKKLPVT